jgi:DNA-binding transcriptional regulator/RsmH inhibitor MraZ
MLVGVGIKFELWSEERWNAKRDLACEAAAPNLRTYLRN